MRVALKFAYDGRKYHGFVRQPNLKTVEDDIIKNLIQGGFIKDVNQACFRVASRTDRGVSSLGNVIAFNTDVSKECIFRGFARDTADADIFVYGFKVVEPDFYPRYAKWRTYRYYLNKTDLKLDKLLDASAAFTGEHNFSNFARIETGKDPLRIIDNIVLTEDDNFFIIDFYAQTFLWNQVRRIVSAFEKVGRGKLTKGQIIEALNNPEKKFDFGLALPEPLILRDVIYDFEFEHKKNYLKKLEEFEKKIIPSA